MGAGIVIGIVLGFIFALIGVILLVVALVARKKAQTAKGWPTAQGTVTSSEVREHQNYDSEDGQTTTNYEPVVQYTYAVMGTPYTGSKIAFGANRFDRGTAQSKANSYMAGSTVTVHYDPSDPRSAVLETEAGGSKVFLIVGIIFAVLGFLACCITGMIAVVSQMAS